MPNFLTQWLERLNSRKSETEVNVITSLQRSAVERRREYFEAKQKADLADDGSLAGSLSASRRRMQEAEAAHIAALQKWENRQARQRSY